MQKRPLFLSIVLFVVLAFAPPGEAKEAPEGLAEAILAGGCFWCIESAFDGVDGVYSAESGYTGGEKADPSYKQVSSGGSGHVEAVRVRFDPGKISYDDVLQIFWRQIDPTDNGGQFADRGGQYRTGIYYLDEQQRETAERSKQELEALGKFRRAIVTPILPASPFYIAEGYHQDYHLKHPVEYKRYRHGSGRTPFLDSVWGKEAVQASETPRPTEAELRARLTLIQYRVTQLDRTEIPFRNVYWDNTKTGIYVDIIDGEPLFSSIDKYKSGSGWPAFTRPLDPESIVERPDHQLSFQRTEVRSVNADSHLGHVFEDGPEPTGLRYCINSAALRFIPVEDLEKEGLAEYIELFKD